MKYIIANWKMNLTKTDVDLWVKNYMESYFGKVFKSSIIISPSAPYLENINKVTVDLDVKVSAQDVSIYEKGAHTGDVGAFQLKDFCTYCIVGHSERMESKDIVLKKADNCLKAEITPIICFTSPQEVTKYYMPGCILAWEDPQNISQNGVYREKDPKDIVDAFALMRSKLPDSAILIYGGSVNRQNASSLVKIHGLDGALVGNASLDPQHFLAIINSFEE